MSIRMLIDASHPEETRVAIVDGNRVEDFDYESSSKKQLKGSIYLAKVTRVEPSLQAAFVDYGGNRHGFLAFSEIHPDYYQIPVADREALIEQEKAANAALMEDDEPKEKSSPKRRSRRPRKKVSETETAATTENTNVSDETKSDVKATDDTDKNSDDKGEEKPTILAEATAADEVVEEDVNTENTSADDETSEENSEVKDENSDEENLKSNNANTDQSDEDEEERLRIKMAKRLRYKYKIQEVIKKNQIILIQVVKEERGNKGAALTTYLSLPGRYCVLMPNTLHGGGVSRKIANIKDRKKLKDILASLNMPKGHACIIRTAGNNRTKPEISRDYDYLKRMWEAIREHTLKSIAPTQIYEEGNLIKRSIRDLYTRDIEEILVEGEEGYNTAKSFMNMLMPARTKKVIRYDDPVPLFQRYKVESHLDTMYSPTAQLKSGGYIVINPTEALVSIDVNSGRATKEHNIEETAINTNLEAAEEIARQLKLRDMAGLIVIDFIDMEEQRNNRAVERRMKSCLKSDRARIQVGRISSFGLMEMSRQRLRVGVLESSTTECPHCEGSGLLRSVESQSLNILRIIEEEGIRARNSKFTVYLPSNVAIYILNNKRNNLTELELRYDFSVSIAIDNELTASAYRMDKSGKPSKTSLKISDSLKMGKDVNKLIDVTEEDVTPNEDQDERPKRRRRRRKNNQNHNDQNNNDQSATSEEKSDEAPNETPNETSDENKDEHDNNDRSRRRRRPRRNRRRNKDDNENQEAQNETTSSDNADTPVEAKKEETSAPQAVEENKTEETIAEEKPKRRPRRTRKPRVTNTETENSPSEDVKEDKADKEEKPTRKRKPRVSNRPDEKKPSDTKVEVKTDEVVDEKPRKAIRKRAPRKNIPAVDTAPKVTVETKVEDKPAPKAIEPVKEEPAKPKKKGWWSRS